MAEVKSEVHTKVHNDYRNNFIPRKEIKVYLSFEEIKECLKELQQEIRLTWHFKFYVKQLFWLSFDKIYNHSNIREVEKTKMFLELKELVEFDSLNETRALVAFVRLEFDKGNISNSDLYEIWNGTSVYDDYCAQIAYREYNIRKKE